MVTPAYTPREDRVERAHRVLGQVLQSDDQFESPDWVSKLPSLVLAYKIAINRIKGVGPFEEVWTLGSHA